MSPPQIAPPWQNLNALADLSIPPFQDPVYTPLWTGDVRETVGSNWEKQGQIALQQDNPLPMEILSVIPAYLPGDTTDLQVKQKQQGQKP